MFISLTLKRLKLNIILNPSWTIKHFCLYVVKTYQAKCFYFITFCFLFFKQNFLGKFVFDIRDMEIHVTSFTSFSYWSNSEYWTQKRTQSKNIHYIILDVHVDRLSALHSIFLQRSFWDIFWLIFLVHGNTLGIDLTLQITGRWSEELMFPLGVHFWVQYACKALG